MGQAASIGQRAEESFAVMDKRRPNEKDRDLETERRLSEEDEWLSASDKTLSDRNQAQSDREQEAVEHDQVAADLERAGGVGSAQRDQADAARGERRGAARNRSASR
jgi:hypothetical protein